MKQVVMVILMLLIAAILFKQPTLQALKILELFVVSMELKVIFLFGEDGYTSILLITISVLFTFYLKPLSMSGIIVIIAAISTDLLICTKIYVEMILKYGESFHTEALESAGWVGRLGADALPVIFGIFTSKHPVDVLYMLLIMIVCGLAFSMMMQLFTKKARP